MVQFSRPDGAVGRVKKLSNEKKKKMHPDKQQASRASESSNASTHNDPTRFSIDG